MKAIILMGDIIDSHKYPQAQLMGGFKNLIQDSNKENKDSLRSPMTITLGDEFQGIVDSMSSGIQIIIGLEEQLLSKNLDFKIRYVLHEGEIETEINRKKAYEMLGKGLTHARNELNLLKKSKYRFKISLSKEPLNHLLNRLFKMLQFFIDSWSAKDRMTVTAFLKGLNYREVARIEKKDESSLWRRQKSLAIEEYLTCKTLIYEAVA